MSETGKPLLSRVFPALMLYCLFVWVWTVAIIMAWPWDKTSEWKADARLPVVCANGQMCSITYDKLAAALAEKQVAAVLPKDPVGELQDPDAWLRWKSVADQPWQIEASLSSWHFETTLRYKVSGDKPELLQYRHYDAGVFFYALPAALFTLLGVYLRRLRR
ncbi:MAG TPA: hypothetical protein VFY24_02255 [Azospira sp.]|nr:hypothetical protein [Azospira sp.]